MKNKRRESPRRKERKHSSIMKQKSSFYRDCTKPETKTFTYSAKRQKRMDDYTAWRAKKDQEYEDNRARRLELRGGFDADDDTTEAFEEETVEFLVKEESTVMQE